jgi:serine/threonine-protein kinase HipA
MLESKQVTELEVYRGLALVGKLERTARGSRFSYVPQAFGSSAHLAPQGISFAMPVRDRPYEVSGVNLDPFFAGLLPEGLRLRALVQHLKSSEDDLFSMLVAVGQNTVGDVWVQAVGSEPHGGGQMENMHELGVVPFTKLISESFDEARDPASVAGVQPKISSEMITIPLGARSKRKEYILKLAPERFPRLVENELFFMKMVKALKLPVAEVELVKDCDGETGLLVQRFDRVPRQENRKEPLVKVHQEDACQLLERYPADKYRLSLREVAGALDICSAPIVERLRLLQWQALSYLICNGDMHGKNISVHSVGSQVRLTPIYDMLSTLPYGDADMALKMDGKDQRLSRDGFIAFGERIGLQSRAVEAMLNHLVKGVGKFKSQLGTIGLTEKKTQHLARTMQERLIQLGGS